jgi:ABC-type multidrug transport system ATPase subunit
VLSGLTCENVTGSIKINGSSNNYKAISNESAYIMQDQNLHPLLSVSESMNFAIKFKTGKQMSSFQQKEKIYSILKQLTLNESQETYVMDLSGGQQKRLSIAIELVSDPKVLFLDEPTTGLDSMSATQCVMLMKKLVDEGKTIICTIHTPSALLFDMFDQLYVLAEGNCIYQGASSKVVPFLADLDLVCPSSYNPADYLLEISTNDYGLHNQGLTDKIRNGANNDFRLKTKTEIPFYDDDFETQSSKHAASFTYQLYLLIYRNIIFMKRDSSLMVLRFAVTLVMAVLVGLVFFQIGPLASHIFDNYKFIYFTTHFLCYASYFSLMAKCKFYFRLF